MKTLRAAVAMGDGSCGNPSSNLGANTGNTITDCDQGFQKKKTVQ